MTLPPMADTARVALSSDRALARHLRVLLLVLAAITVVALSMGVALAVNATVGIQADTTSTP